MSKGLHPEVDLTGEPWGLASGGHKAGSIFGDAREAAGETWEGLQWRLSEVEAKTHQVEDLEARVDAIISELLASHNGLYQQVTVLEKALGILSPPKAPFSVQSWLNGSSASKSRRDVLSIHSSNSPATSATNQLREGSTTEDLGPLTGTGSGLGQHGPGQATAANSSASFSMRLSKTGSQALGLFGRKPGREDSHWTKASDPGASLYGSPTADNTAQAVVDIPRSSFRTSTSKGLGGSSSDTTKSISNGNSNSGHNNNHNNCTNFSSPSAAPLDTCTPTANRICNLSSTLFDGESVSTLEAHVTRTLSPSVWNAAFLVGMNRTGFAASLSIILLLLINISMQGTFLLIINQIVSNQLFDSSELETLKNWRLFVGQSVKYYDPLTKTSLTQRICAVGEDFSTLPVDLSDSKAQLVEAIKAYLPAGEDFFSHLVSGPSLSLIALTFWTCKVIAELLDILDTGVGILSVPLGQRNIVVETSEGKFRFASFIAKQRVVFVITLLVRTFVCILLWALGCDFLMNYSIEPAELILNAVALEIVLNVDEVLYALIPASCKHLMNHLEPLPGPPTLRQWRGLDGRSAILTVLLMTSVFLYYSFGVLSLVDRVDSAYDAICEGERNVIFATDPFQFVYSAGLDENDGSKDNVNSGARTAILELVYPDLIPLRVQTNISGYYPLAFPQSGRRDPASYLQQVSVMTNAEASINLQENQFGAECSDMVSDHGSAVAKAYMADYGIEAHSCDDLRPLCNEDLSTRVLCPETCGCDTPFGDVFDLDTSGGCPEVCTQVGRWDTEIENQPCEDLSLEYLNTQSWWRKWVGQVEVLSTEASTGYEEVKYLICQEYDGNCTPMLQLGCEFVSVWNARVQRFIGSKYSPDACTGRFFGTALPVMWRPLAPICPEACGCIENPDQTTYIGEVENIKICPQSCAAVNNVANASNGTNGSAD